MKKDKKKKNAIVNPFKNPIVGILTTIDEMKNMSVTGERKYRDTAINTELPDKTVIDTCIGFDTGLWETGIKYHKDVWKIVQQYRNEKSAKAGHKKWVAEINKNPGQKLKDIYTYWEE